MNEKFQDVQEIINEKEKLKAKIRELNTYKEKMNDYDAMLNTLAMKENQIDELNKKLEIETNNHNTIYKSLTIEKDRKKALENKMTTMETEYKGLKMELANLELLLNQKEEGKKEEASKLLKKMTMSVDNFCDLGAFDPENMNNIEKISEKSEESVNKSFKKHVEINEDENVEFEGSFDYYNDIDKIKAKSVEDKHIIKNLQKDIQKLEKANEELLKQKNNLIYKIKKQNPHIEEYNKDSIYESQIMKWSNKLNELKTYYMSVNGMDLNYYTDDSKNEMKHTHSLVGSFIKENPNENIANEPYFSFSIIFTDKTRTYLLKDKHLYNQWIKYLKIALGYKNFFDDYQTFDNLGEGAIGIVKLGENKMSKEKVAVKIIRKSKLKPIEADLVKNEIEILEKINHQSIVKFVDHFENLDYIFIVREYVKYGNLREFLSKHKFNITEITASKIALQIAGALKYLHSFGIIHRDLKPDNIMISDSSDSHFEVKIKDFCLSKMIGPKEDFAEGYGTLRFIAPEILMRKPYNNNSDIWSFGIIMYYIMSGELPFDDSNDDEEVITKKIVTEVLQFPEAKWKNRSLELKNFISRCLEKSMRKRITLERLVDHDWIKLMKKTD